MHILNIGLDLKTSPRFKVRKTSFLSGPTLLDADIIFWNVNSSYNNVFPGGYRNINETDKNLAIANLEKAINNRKKELEEFFKIGRTLVITNPIFHRYEYKFKNGEENKILDYINCINIPKPNFESVYGENMKTIQEDFVSSFYRTNKRKLKYILKITKSSGIPLMFIKDTNYLVSEFYKVNNGYVLILPDVLSFSSPSESEVFISSTLELIENLPKLERDSPRDIPDWVEEYTLDGESKELEKETKLLEKLKATQTSIEKTRENLSNFNFLKALFASNGDTLEQAVEFIFQEFGFDIDPSEPNRDDLILKVDKKVAVVEIKGLSKSAAEKNAAQLQKWVTNYHLANDFNPKGILIVNTFRNEKLENRKNVDFPNQMLAYTTRMEHCLITGIQLLCIYLDFKAKKIKKNEIVKLLFDTIGEVKYTNNILEYITPK